MGLLGDSLFTSGLSGNLSTGLSRSPSMGLQLIGVLGEFAAYGSSTVTLSTTLTTYSATNGGSQIFGTVTLSPAWLVYFETTAFASTLYQSRIYFDRTLTGFSGPQFLGDPGNTFGGTDELAEVTRTLASLPNMQARVYIGDPNTEGNQVRTFGPAVSGSSTNIVAAATGQNYLGFGCNTPFVVPVGGFPSGTSFRIELYPAGYTGLTANDDYGLFADPFSLSNDYGTFDAEQTTTDYGSF